MSSAWQERLANSSTLWLIGGRTIGLVAAFAVSLVVVRVFDQGEYGTYRQLFLIFMTLFGLAQLGMAESLYYFVPRDAGRAGTFVLSAVATLAVVGVVCGLALTFFAAPIASALTNPALAEPLPLLAVFLALMLVAAPLEIVLVAQQRHRAAATAYAMSDIARALAILIPAIAVGSVRGVLWGVVVFAALRLAAMLWAFRRSIWRRLTVDPALWRTQWAYTLPFALAVGVEAVQANVHHFVVASRVDPATFAIYAVGCLQIPLVDVVATSSATVMMVTMAAGGFERTGAAALALWHDTSHRLALLIFPVAVFLIAMAGDVIGLLFTRTYLASVPIFMWWTVGIVFTVPCVDAILRVHAQTRFLFWLNVLRLVMVLSLTGLFLTWFGLVGAVLVVLLSTAVARAAAVVRIAQLLGIGISSVLPWSRLAVTAMHALVAVVPTLWFARATALPRPAALLGAGAVYATCYAALWYGSWRLRPAPAIQDAAS